MAALAYSTTLTLMSAGAQEPTGSPSAAPAAYGGAGSIDGKIPGRFWINLRTTDLHSKYSLADLTFHEAIPGHIWQGEYTHELPLIRQMLAFNAYSEGWALYAEQLADELGAFENDPVGRLGGIAGFGGDPESVRTFRSSSCVKPTRPHLHSCCRPQTAENSRTNVAHCPVVGRWRTATAPQPQRIVFTSYEFYEPPSCRILVSALSRICCLNASGAVLSPGNAASACRANSSAFTLSPAAR
jgi:Bacterial protein of unknown function (DUF885)